MARSVRKCQASTNREVLHTPLTLANVLQKLQAVWVSQRLRDLGELRENYLLRPSA